VIAGRGMTIERAAEKVAGLVDGKRRVGVRASDGAKREGEVGDGSAEASVGAESGPVPRQNAIRAQKQGCCVLLCFVEGRSALLVAST
jgi:hypothetical protein